MSNEMPSSRFGLRPGFKPEPQISHVIFDFDGTLSWLRHGWPGMMARIMQSYYPARPDESARQAYDFLMADLLSLNGKPTIYQMYQFEQRVHARGGTCPSAEQLRQQYQDELDAVIEQRSELIRSGRAKPDEFVVFGARGILEKLKSRGLQLVILSGTIEHRVREEAELLGLAPYFGRHIYGGTADHFKFSKRQVIERLLAEEKIEGHHLLSFGDGPIEIQETKSLGGVAIAVASNEEENGTGKMDPWKRQQLLEAGADGVIADYRDSDLLIETIFG